MPANKRSRDAGCQEGIVDAGRRSKMTSSLFLVSSPQNACERTSTTGSTSEKCMLFSPGPPRISSSRHEGLEIREQRAYSSSQKGRSSSSSEPSSAGAGVGSTTAGAEVTCAGPAGVGDGFAGTAAGGGVTAGMGEPAGTVGAPNALATHRTCCHKISSVRS